VAPARPFVALAPDRLRGLCTQADGIASAFCGRWDALLLEMRLSPMNRRLLLMSTSTVFGTGYLEHGFPELREFLGSRKRVLFIPYALADHEGYAARARAAFLSIGYALDSIHEAASAKEALRAAEAVFVGGGNTWRLLKTLYDMDLMSMLRTRVLDGSLLYAGASAGSNLAGPTLKTTNDMPIVEPPTFSALGLVSFQINPHYLDPDPGSKHMGETRETRLREFHEENDTPVVGLREGAILRVEGESVVLKGQAGARLFRRGQEPVEVVPGASLGALLAPH
jgi:dipeptidase E